MYLHFKSSVMIALCLFDSKFQSALRLNHVCREMSTCGRSRAVLLARLFFSYRSSSFCWTIQQPAAARLGKCEANTTYAQCANNPESRRHLAMISAVDFSVHLRHGFSSLLFYARVVYVTKLLQVYSRSNCLQ